MSLNNPTDQQIKDMLLARASYLDIQAKYKVSSKTIAAIAKREGLQKRHVASKDSKPTQEPACNPKILEGLRFLNEFFKTNSDYLFGNPTIVKYIEENGEKFTEVENLCQA